MAVASMLLFITVLVGACVVLVVHGYRASNLAWLRWQSFVVLLTPWIVVFGLLAGIMIAHEKLLVEDAVSDGWRVDTQTPREVMFVNPRGQRWGMSRETPGDVMAFCSLLAGGASLTYGLLLWLIGRAVGKWRTRRVSAAVVERQ